MTNFKKIIKEQYKENYDYVLRNIEYTYNQIEGMLNTRAEISIIKDKDLIEGLRKEQKRLKVIINYCNKNKQLKQKK